MKFSIKINSRRQTPETNIAIETITRIRDAMAKENINASGDTSKSLQGVETDYRLTIKAVGNHAPFRTLQHGSGPHKKDYPKGFVDAIQKWVRIKPNFTPFVVRKGADKEQQYTDAAWAIIGAIRRRGTKRYLRPRNDIYTPYLKKCIDDFKRKVAIITINKIIG